jgi:transposase
MLGFLSLDDCIPRDHPIRTIKRLADTALARLSPRFDQLYAHAGRPSIPPEQLLKGSLLMALYSVRSERQLCEQFHSDLLFRAGFWILTASTRFSSPRSSRRPANAFSVAGLEGGLGEELFDAVVADANERGLLSREPFSVDGTLIEAAATLKSLRRKDGTPPTGD